jgi:hypothetical protein
MSAGDSGGVVTDHFERHGHGGVEAEEDVADGVADENDVHAGIAREAGDEGVVSGDGHDGTLAFELTERVDGGFHRKN